MKHWINDEKCFHQMDSFDRQFPIPNIWLNQFHFISMMWIAGSQIFPIPSTVRIYLAFVVIWFEKKETNFTKSRLDNSLSLYNKCSITIFYRFCFIAQYFPEIKWWKLWCWIHTSPLPMNELITFWVCGMIYFFQKKSFFSKWMYVILLCNYLLASHQRFHRFESPKTFVPKKYLFENYCRNTKVESFIRWLIHACVWNYWCGKCSGFVSI